MKQRNLPVLPFKTNSFQQWSRLQKEYALSDKLQAERGYWEQILSKEVDILYSGDPSLLSKGSVKVKSFILDKDITELLQTRTNHVYSTEINDILLSCLGVSISKAFGIDRSVVELEGHGRENIIPEIDITRTVGWFTTFYPFVLDVSRSVGNLESALVSVKENLRKVPNKGIGYGILRYSDSGFTQDLVPSIIFNYLGDFGTGITSQGKKGIGLVFGYSRNYKGRSFPEENNALGVKLSISGILIMGELHISVSYNDKIYPEESISELMTRYESNLRLLIENLSKKNKRYLTPSDLTFKGLSIPELSIINMNNDLEDVYKMSPLQEGLYYHWLKDPKGSAYFAQNSYQLRIPHFDQGVFKKSYDLLVDRHSIFRTSFSTDYGAENLQIVRKSVESGFTYREVPQEIINSNKIADFVSNYKLEDRARAFDLSTESQLRLSVLGLGDNVYEFIWSNHHILMDGWCASILVNDFYKIFHSLENNTPLKLPPPVPYSSYIKWLDRLDKKRSLSYWQEYLLGYEQKALVPFRSIYPKSKEYSLQKETLYVEGYRFSKLRGLCREYDITESTFIQSVWGYLLSRYNTTDDVVYGAVVSGRSNEVEGVEDMMGLLINTIPVRVNCTQVYSPKDLLKSQQKSSISSLDHHYLSLSEVQSQSKLGLHLIDHVIVFKNQAVQEFKSVPGQRETQQERISLLSRDSFERTNYDFGIQASPGQQSMDIHFTYNENVYKTKGMAQIKKPFFKCAGLFYRPSDISFSEH